ncbi:MAG TPA: hypothetical protein VK983_05230 [Candidatus Limnocylindrales bacterium]|nr:hypothetical protein [Candidatus Limnocylindrales bacterium]
MFKYLGLLLVLFSWAILIALILRRRDIKLRTISSHGAYSQKAALYFAVTLIGLGVPFYFWILYWLVPHIGLGAHFKIVITMALLLNIITAIIVDSIGWRRIVHRITAASMFIAFLVMSLLIIHASGTSNYAQTIGWVLLTYILVSAIIVAISNFGRRNALIFEILFLMSVQGIILAAAYL